MRIVKIQLGGSGNCFYLNIENLHGPDAGLMTKSDNRPTRHVIHVHCLIARFQEIILLTVQYKC